MSRSLFKRIVSRLDRMPTRTRILITLLVIALFGAIGYFGIISPSIDRAAQQQKKAAALLMSAKESLERVADLEHHKVSADVAAMEQRLRTAENQLSAQEGDFEGIKAGLTSSLEVLPMLNTITGKTHGIKVRSIEPMEVEEINKPAESEKEAQGYVRLYKHAFKVTVQGDYWAVANYVRMLSDLAPELKWGGFSLKVTSHPSVIATLMLFTVSTEEKWISGSHQ